jgi:hypothetical protein
MVAELDNVRVCVFESRVVSMAAGDVPVEEYGALREG